VKTLALLAAAVLWNDPGPVRSLDLANGPGGRSGAPQPPYVFNTAEASGTSPKVIVTDSNKRKWTIKFGPEVKSETFATRIVWAAGFFAEPAYYVPQGRIESPGSLGRAEPFIKNGQFEDARFELRDNMAIHYLPGSTWSLEDVEQSPEGGMLKALIALLANWDIKPENFAIVDVNGTRHYAITDWGATMGRAEDFSGRSKWDCASYARDSERFVQDVQNGFVVLNYAGKQRHVVTRGIRVEHAKKLADRLGKVTDTQLRAALHASGATPDEIACFVPALRKRINQLATAVQVSPEGDVIRSRKVTTKTTEIKPQ
jgi:hypothetical protein